LPAQEESKESRESRERADDAAGDTKRKEERDAAVFTTAKV